MGDAKLLRTWSNPIALRINWALKLKGIEYETIYEDLVNESSLILEYNPVYKKVPVLLHNETPFCESLVILGYIDETWSTSTRFLLEDPLGTANARFWAKFNDEQVVPSFLTYVISQEKDQEEAKIKALDNLQLVEAHLNGMKFFGGETFGFLDLAFGWLACYPGIAKKAINLELLDEETFPNLWKWKEQLCDIPVIKENWPDEKVMIMMYQETKAVGYNFYNNVTDKALKNQ